MLLPIGTRIITTEENGFTSPGRKGFIMDVDEMEGFLPYKVLLDGEVLREWVYAEDIMEDKQ